MSSLDENKYNHLTPEQVSSFMAYGFLRLESCFTHEKAAEWTSTLWQRLGMDPNDKSTWSPEWINMPFHRSELVSNFAPKAWGAICELLGGEDRIEKGESEMWKDGFILNLGRPDLEGSTYDPKDLDGWHVDGDFFVHFLDSREQALLVIPVFTDIIPGGGGTMICCDAIAMIAKHLYDHPKGVSPMMVPNGQESRLEGFNFFNETVQSCNEFYEMTGNVGDVILMHPLMVHSASRNVLRNVRIITNPPVSLKTEFCFTREDPKAYSLVELKTLKALGKGSLIDWKATGSREEIVPDRLRVQNEMKVRELKRLEVLGVIS